LPAPEKPGLFGRYRSGTRPEERKGSAVLPRTRMGTGDGSWGSPPDGDQAGDPDRLECGPRFPTPVGPGRATEGKPIPRTKWPRRKPNNAARHGCVVPRSMQELVERSRGDTARLPTRLRALRQRAGRRYRLQSRRRRCVRKMDAERIVLEVQRRERPRLVEPTRGALRRTAQLGAATISIVNLTSSAVVAPVHTGSVSSDRQPVLGARSPAALWPDRAPGGQGSSPRWSRRKSTRGRIDSRMRAWCSSSVTRLATPHRPELLQIVSWPRHPAVRAGTPARGWHETSASPPPTAPETDRRLVPRRRVRTASRRPARWREELSK